MRPYSYDADRNTFVVILLAFGVGLLALMAYVVHSRVNATMKKNAAIPPPDCGWVPALACDDVPGRECAWVRRWRCGGSAAWPQVVAR